MSAAVPAIAIRDVVKHYGALRALDEVSLEIRQGEFFGLLGPNGAGKTTLISIIAGLARASAGQVAVMGFDTVRESAQSRLNLGVVPQELVFDPFFTVRETLRITSGYYGIRANDDWIDEILANLDLSAKANANMRALSGGMKRRVLVAQALVHRPPVIILDEPTAGVDVELRQTLWRFIGRLNREGHTIILTTHYLEEAESLCTRIAMLKSGRVVALDDTRRLLARVDGLQLAVRLASGELPPELLARVHPLEEGAASGRIAIRLSDYAEVEPTLAAIRASGATIDELEVQRADLEDVFLQIMSGDANAASSSSRRAA
ncbi:MAG TPA: ABC transporter ATP-binding protein [Burkholderiaceae bacterium]|nr:ABC transporter ATP-binding protein [Burkholderiaceae bacterium]